MFRICRVADRREIAVPARCSTVYVPCLMTHMTLECCPCASEESVLVCMSHIMLREDTCAVSSSSILISNNPCLLPTQIIRFFLYQTHARSTVTAAKLSLLLAVGAAMALRLPFVELPRAAQSLPAVTSTDFVRCLSKGDQLKWLHQKRSRSQA